MAEARRHGGGSAGNGGEATGTETKKHQGTVLENHKSYDIKFILIRL